MTDIESHVDELFAGILEALDRFGAASKSKDQQGQLNSFRDLDAIKKELAGIAAKQRAAVRAIVAAARAPGSTAERAARLAQAYRDCLKIRDFVHDVMGNLALSNFIATATSGILKDLDALPDGRRALVPMLDDPDPGVRLSGATALLETMPERALPMLLELQDHPDVPFIRGLCARVTLLDYKHKHPDNAAAAKKGG